MNRADDLPADFKECVRFHGHVCPGLAIGYAATKAGMRALKAVRAEDEEIVAVVENESCAVDAVQVLLGCTFGKGNLIFRDWGKQVFTFFDRKTGQGVRVSLRDELPGRADRHELRRKIDSGVALDSDKKKWAELRDTMTKQLVSDGAERYFEVRQVHSEIPEPARVVDTQPCSVCGEPVMTTRLLSLDGRTVCHECAAKEGLDL
jgi:formylmethanofuran dehydrogenase subunit E